MISATAEYALRAVVQLARLGGGPATAEEIANATQVPSGYLSRVLRDLARSGILTARRGIGGGFALAKPAGRITVWDVMKAVDGGFQRIERCPLDIPGHDEALCALHALLDNAVAHVENAFKTATIQSILIAQGGVKPLCVTRAESEPPSKKPEADRQTD